MNKLVVGLTGEIGCGKSHIANQFLAFGKRDGISVVNVDMDVIAHDLLENNVLLKKEVLSIFLTVERKELSKLVFDSKINRKILDEIFYPYVQKEIKRKIDESIGLILINGALLIEAGFFQEFCDYQTILVLTPADIQLKSLLKRGYPLKNCLKRINAQLSSVMKYSTACEMSQKAGRGFVDCIYNYRGDENIQVFDLLRKYNEKRADIHSGN
jgi:dephospho-CoA kinase